MPDNTNEVQKRLDALRDRLEGNGDLIALAAQDALADALAHQHQEGTGVGEDWPARVRMMAEKLDAAADTWQDRDDLPDHCRRLANRARQIVNAIPATSPTEQGGEISPDIPAPNWFPPTWKGEMP